MAWTQQLASGKHRALYRDARGRSRSAGTFDHKPAAKRAAEVAEDKARRGSQHDPNGPRLRWGEWADTWWASRGVQQSTQRGAEPKLRLHVRPRWEDVRLGEVSRLDVQKWINDLAGRRSASTTRQCYYLLSSSFKAAIAHGLVDVNPCTGVTLPTLPQGQERYLTHAEVDRILYNLDGPARMLAELLVGTGMRISEACGLHIDRLHLDKRTIDVVHVYDNDTHTMQPYPKGKKRRTVPITDDLAEKLGEWLKAHPPEKDCGRKHSGDSCRGGLVITGEKGAPIDPHNFTNRDWQTAVDFAGIGHARPHDLRHTYASWLLQDGVKLSRISKLLGHASMATTERYAHLQDDDHDEVRDALERSQRVADGVARRLTVVSDETRRRTKKDTA